MKRMTSKLFIAVIMLIIIVVIGVSVSYAWVTLSSSPAVSGAQVTIAGGTTILLAPDLTSTQAENGNEVIVHYPGEFSNNLIFSHYESYDYLSGLVGITPVSTADGVSWVLPSYNGATGLLNDLDEFTVDRTLRYANATDPHAGGKYVYVDFWVVSPGSEYKLRVSTDVKSKEGSSLLELPSAKTDRDSFTGFSLESTTGEIESIARVGFLVNSEPANDLDTLAYTRSIGFESRYGKLLGRYSEPGDEPQLLAQNKFTIYEPNGGVHVTPGLEQGSYSVTRPLGYDPFTQVISETDVSDILTVQTRSRWTMAGEERLLDQMFQTAVSGVSGLTEESATARFYQDYLQGQVMPYITTGEFFTRTETLYQNAVNGYVSPTKVAENLTTSGATDDVYIIELERNTPQRVRMFIWLEGQDADCATSSAGASGFVLNLELAGSN